MASCVLQTGFKLLKVIIEVLTIFTLFLALKTLLIYVVATLKVCVCFNICVVEHSTIFLFTSLIANTYLFLNPNSSMMSFMT